MSDSSFNCIKCGTCCRVKGYIILTFLDVIRLSQHLIMSVNDILNQFTHYSTDSRQILLEIPCKFQKENLCSVYPARPIQCIMYPFWGEILQAENSEMEQKCREYCVAIRNWKPELSRQASIRIQQLDYILYNTNHLEILTAMGFLSSKEVQEYEQGGMDNG